MDYELAKQLKDAGFPQKYHDMGKYYLFGNAIVPFSAVKGAIGDNGCTIEYKKVLVYIPTLSELIEACGNEFYSMERNYSGMGVDFIARSHQVWCVSGSTPEEAVAKLWLELNKKESFNMGVHFDNNGATPV